MSDTLSVIRHTNARKLLSRHCDNVIRRFAEAIGKGEQQCSNFLRIKNPVKIGTKVAREIEFAFGYPNGWLDLEEEQAQSDVKYVNSDILSTFITIEESIKTIAARSIDGFSFHEALVARTRLKQIEEKQRKLAKHIAYDLNEQTIKQLHAALHRLDLHIIDHPHTGGVGSMYAAVTKNGLAFRLGLGADGVYESYPQTYMMMYLDDAIIDEFECFPILVDGQPAVVILNCPKSTRHLEELADWRVYQLIKAKNEFTSKEVSEELAYFINTHPKLNN